MLGSAFAASPVPEKASDFNRGSTIPGDEVIAAIIAYGEAKIRSG
jgi:hypothetical protein